MKMGDIIYSNREPELSYRVVGYERNAYESSWDMANVQRVDLGDDGPVIGIPRHKWDYWIVREDNGGDPLPAG